MKTHVLLGIVAFLVRAIWVLLAKAGWILRLLVRVETNPRTTLQAALQFIPPQPLPLSAAERIICLQVVDGKLDSPNVDPRYRDTLRSGSLPFDHIRVLRVVFAQAP